MSLGEAAPWSLMNTSPLYARQILALGVPVVSLQAKTPLYLHSVLAEPWFPLCLHSMSRAGFSEGRPTEALLEEKSPGACVTEAV